MRKQKTKQTKDHVEPLNGSGLMDKIDVQCWTMYVVAYFAANEYHAGLYRTSTALW